MLDGNPWENQGKTGHGGNCLLSINDNSQTKFFISLLQSRVASGKPLLTKRPAQLKLAKSTSSLPKPCGIICFGLMRPKLNIVAIIPEEMFATKETSHPQKDSIPQCSMEAHNHVLGLLLYSWSWGFNHAGENNEYQPTVNLKASAKKLKMTWNFTFQQDNDPKHNSKSTN